MNPSICKSSLLFLLLTVIMAFNFSPATAQETPNTVNYETVKNQIIPLIEAQMKKHTVKGLSIALLDDQKLVWSQGFGYADTESKIPITSDTLFRTASITKLFTATAIMRLVDQGKIDLDQPLQTYLPKFKIKSHSCKTENITIRMLLTHHSGLPDVHLHGQFSAEPEAQFPSLLEELKDEYTAYSPNYILSYSNIGFTLLGKVIEQVTGQNFSAYMEAEILNPLGMNHSSFTIREDMKRLITPSFNEANQPILNVQDRDVPAGGLYSSAAELANFIKMVFANGRFQDQNLLKSDTVTRMLTPQNYGVPLDLNFPIGLAWFLKDESGKLGHAGKVAQHSGDIFGYHNILLTLPAHKLGVVVLTNSAYGSAIVDQVATETIRLALEAKTGFRSPEIQPKLLPEITLTPGEIQRYQGYYAHAGLGMMTINPAGETCSANFLGQDWKVQFHEGHWFSLSATTDEPASEMLYYKITQINHRSVIIYKTSNSDVESVIGEALTVKPLSMIWQNRIDTTYQVMNDLYMKDTRVKLYKNGPFMAMEFKVSTGAITGTYQFILDPLSNEQARTCGLGREANLTIRFEKDSTGRELLCFSGLKLAKVEN